MNHSRKTLQIVAPADGAPTELAVRETVLPAPGDSHVQVEIRAAGVNPADLVMLAGS